MSTETLNPTGAGAATQLTPVGGTNWAVNADSDDGTYVHWESYGAGPAGDLYAVANTTFATGAVINSVTLYARGKSVGWTTSPGSFGLQSGATSDWESVPETSITNKSKVYPTDPNTGVAWTKAAIDALEIGWNNGNDSADGCELFGYKCYIVVDYPLIEPVNTDGGKASDTPAAEMAAAPVASDGALAGDAASPEATPAASDGAKAGDAPSGLMEASPVLADGAVASEGLPLLDTVFRYTWPNLKAVMNADGLTFYVSAALVATPTPAGADTVFEGVNPPLKAVDLGDGTYAVAGRIV